MSDSISDASAQELLETVATATSLREGPQGVALLLRLVYGARKIPLNELARRAGLPVPVVAAVRRELERRRLVRREGGVALTAAGQRLVEEGLEITTRHDPACRHCGGRRIVIGPTFQPVVERLAGFSAANPTVDVTLDQAPCTAESAVRRVLFMYEAGALEGKKVLILGDDDSVALAIACTAHALGRPTLVRRLVVLEVDERRVHHLESVSRAEGLAIECRPFDLKDPLPVDLRHQFDTFETDPSYTLAGANLFVSRALDALKPGVGQQGFLSFGPKSPDELLRLQFSLCRMGLAMREVLPSFNDYEGASLLAGKSQLLHLLTTPQTRALLPDAPYNGPPIYTGEVSPTKRLYRCTECKTTVHVGSGQRFVTIEALKQAGCQTCGNRRFRYLRRGTPPPGALS